MDGFSMQVCRRTLVNLICKDLSYEEWSFEIWHFRDPLDIEWSNIETLNSGILLSLIGVGMADRCLPTL